MKNDINLLYKRKTKSNNGKRWLFILLFLALMAGCLYVGITLPAKLLTDAKLKLLDLEGQLITSANTELELNEKSQYNNLLNEQIKELEILTDAKADVSMYLDTIEKSLPTKVQLTQLSLNGNTLSISGMAPGDEEIATFALRLRETNEFVSVFVNNSALSASDSRTMFNLEAILPTSLSGIALVSESSENMQNTADSESAAAPTDAGSTAVESGGAK